MFGLANSSVSWNDYAGVEGLGGIATQQDVDDLNKALTAGQDINNPGASAGQGFPFRVESLDSTLRVTTFTMKDIQLWKRIFKQPAYNTVEEYNVLSSYGSNTDAGFIPEGGLPEEDDSTPERKYAVVKYMGTTRRVTHVMSLVKSAHENVITGETVRGTMHLIRMLESALYYGDSALCALQFDGFQKLMTSLCPSTNIIDLRGAPLSEDNLTDGALTAHDAPNYGTVTELHLNPKVKADLVKTFFPKERHDTFTKNGGMVGLDIKGFTSPAGDVAFVPNAFINDGGAPNAAAIGDATKIPASPTVSTAATSPADATAQFTAVDAGDYYYQVVACNRFGRSAKVSVGAAVTVATGDKVTFGLTPSSSISVEWYDIYRTAKDGASGTERRILRMANAAGTGEQTINDLNAYLPYCTSAFLFQQNQESMGFKQLTPMVKMPLAQVDTSIRWMQLLYGVPALFTPNKNILYINVGRASGYVGAA